MGALMAWIQDWLGAARASQSSDPVRTNAIELRVHGVSGTPPEALLDRAEVQQVAGNRIAGFYRPRILEQRTDAAPTVFAAAHEPAPQLEGYNWGGLTSGSSGRAFWLVLLPFTLANLVPRARPVVDSRVGTWLFWYLSRLLALALTVLLVLAAAGVGQDLIGWQCNGSSACQNATPNWIFGRVFGTWSGGVRSGGLTVERTLLLGTVIPALVLFAIWFFSGRTINRYESIVPNTAPANPGDGSANATEVNLDSPWMWNSQAQVRRLRAIHVQVGVAAIVWTLLGPLQAPWDVSTSRPDLRSWSKLPQLLWYELQHHLWSLVPAAMLLYAVISLAIPRFVGRAPSRVFQVLSFVWWPVLILTGLYQLGRLLWGGAVLRAQYFTGTGGRRGYPADGLPGYGPTLLGIFLAAILILLLVIGLDLILAARAPRRLTAPAGSDHQPQRAGAGGLTSSVFAVFAVMLAAVFSAGTYVFSAAWLETGSVKPGLSEVVRTARLFHLPEVTRDAGLAYVAAVGFLTVVLVIVLACFLWSFLGPVRLGALDQAPAHDYPDVSSDPIRNRQIRKAIYLARLVDHAPVVIAPLVIVGFLLGLFFAVLLFAHHVLHLGWAARLTDRLAPAVSDDRYRFWSFEQLAGLGSYLAVTTVLGIIALGVVAFRVEATRKTVGILWDVASFWPRAAHPLAAPCYAERTVPDLVTRIAFHRSSSGDPTLVLAAHSQGTVISTAAVFHLDACGDDGQAILRQVKLLTFGNVMRRLYGRYFPVYFGPARLAALQHVLTTEGRTRPRWTNLWRYTDYLGGQVTAGPPSVIPAGPAYPAPVHGPVDWEWHSPDPAHYAIQPGDTIVAPAHRHSDFWMDESGYFQAAVHDLIYRRP